MEAKIDASLKKKNVFRWKVHFFCRIAPIFSNLLNETIWKSQTRENFRDCAVASCSKALQIAQSPPLWALPVAQLPVQPASCLILPFFAKWKCCALGGDVPSGQRWWTIKENERFSIQFIRVLSLFLPRKRQGHENRRPWTKIIIVHYLSLSSVAY